jgi:hypothetical protein
VSCAEIYDPLTGTFSPTGCLVHTRWQHTAEGLADGTVLIIGGENICCVVAAVEIYDSATGTFSLAGNPPDPRDFHTATGLPDGTVLVAGGLKLFDIDPANATAEIYDPATGTFLPTGSLAQARYIHTATGLADGTVLMAAGYDGHNGLGSAEIYDPATGEFSPTGGLAHARAHHTATGLADGTVLVVGGYDGTSRLAAAELYQPGLAPDASPLRAPRDAQ